MASMSEMFNTQITEVLAKMYYELLKNYDYETLEKACYDILRTHKYNNLPKPAEIIEAIEGSTEDKAMVAWQSVIETIRKHDYYWSIEFEDKIIHSCIENLGGWMWLCDQTKDNLKFIMKDFIRMYKTFQRYPREPNNKLLGYFEQQNSKGSFDKDIPKKLFVPKTKEVKKLIGEAFNKGEK